MYFGKVKPTNFIVPYLLLLLLLLSQCSSPSRFVFKTEDFHSFYIKFHSDSSFQMSRIKTPLEGSLVIPHGVYEWEMDNWTMLTIPVFDVDTSVFQVDYHKQNDAFTQKSWIEGSGLFTEYRFKLIKKRWYLVYAHETNL